MTSIREAAVLLAAAGVPSARHDAEALARHLCGDAGTADWRHRDLGPDYDRLVERRASREPLQHIVGTAPFRHLEVEVGPGVFVPRPETELVAGAVIDAVRAADRPVVVDLCTGPGTIALAVAQEVPAAAVHGLDVDPTALHWARRNAARLGLSVTWHPGSVRDALHDLDGAVDVVVSNPPYIALADAQRVDPEAREHEAEVALFAGADGLDVICDVVAAADRLLLDGGLLVMEHADDQGETVPALVAGHGGFTEVADHRDLTGRDRYVTARRDRG